MKRLFTAFSLVVLTAFAASAEESADTKIKVKVSGFVNLTMSEDFNGSLNCYDIIPALIDVPNDNYNNERFRMDFSTSRFNIDATKYSPALGEVELHLDVDFRGGSEGSYTPRMRTGYIKVGNIMVGKTFSNFADLGSMLPQVDFQGPVGYCFNYSPQIRYTYSSENEHWSLSASLEYLPQSLSSDIMQGGEFQRVTQKYPTVPAYAQYSWGEDRFNYFKLSAICRPQSVYNTTTQESLSMTGWGTQASGVVRLLPAFSVAYNGIYGESISEYISDLYGSGLEYTVNPASTKGIETTPMYGWNVGVMLTLTKALSAAAAYSESVIACEDKRLFDLSDYKSGKFASANLFYKATESLTFATEYVWGRRENMSGEYGVANRMYLMAQYNF